MQYVLDKRTVEHTERQSQDKEPAKYVLVLSVSSTTSLISYFSMTAVIGHALVAHCNLSQVRARAIAYRAQVKGRVVIRVLTKEIGETMISDIERCGTVRSFDGPFRFTLEEA